jgi:hypothetical protein
MKEILMSIFNLLRKFLLGYLPENTGPSCEQRVQDHEGFLTVNSHDDSMTIPLPFNPLECHADLLTTTNPPSCKPREHDKCHAEKGFWSITVTWDVEGERKIRWVAKQRVT